MERGKVEHIYIYKTNIYIYSFLTSLFAFSGLKPMQFCIKKKCMDAVELNPKPVCSQYSPGQFDGTGFSTSFGNIYIRIYIYIQTRFSNRKMAVEEAFFLKRLYDSSRVNSQYIIQ